MIKRLKDTEFNYIFTHRENSRMPYGANKAYEDTEMHQAFIVNAAAIGFNFSDDDRPERIVKAFFASTASYLSKNKIANTQEAVALILTDPSGNFKFAGIVEYHENENPDEPGNWSYVTTFNEDDVTNLEKSKSVKKLLYGSDPFKTVFDKVAYDVAGVSFEHDSYMYDACLLVIDTLTQVLDREAKIGEVVDIDMPGYFTASVAVEDDVKVMAITPDGHMKAIIKDDSSLEK